MQALVKEQVAAALDQHRLEQRTSDSANDLARLHTARATAHDEVCRRAPHPLTTPPGPHPFDHVPWTTPL